MDMPKPPDDPELRNIIDKLANFVARNGPEFEQMTKQKQKDNPKFSFLFSGEFFAYYQFRVSTEHANLKQQQRTSPQMPLQMGGTPLQQKVAPWSAPVPSGSPMPQMPSGTPNSRLSAQASGGRAHAIGLLEQLENLRQTAADQIQVSENNLSAQYQNLMQQQQMQLEEALSQAKKNQLMSLSAECDISLDELQKIVQPIIDSCTKDAISNGKNWILSNFKSHKHGELMAYYLLERIIEKDAIFELRLHLIYLINDILHHCMRKNISNFRQILEGIAVVPAFCLSFVAANEEGKGRLNKLLHLWENNHYFNPSTIEKMKDPNIGISDYQAFLLSTHTAVVAGVTTATSNHFMSLQKQHQEFVAHFNRQISSLEQQLHSQQPITGSNMNQQPGFIPAPPGQVSQTNQEPPNQMAPNFMPSNFGPPPSQHNFNQHPPGGFTSGGAPAQSFDMAPLDMVPGNVPPIHLPDLSKPPPGFPGAMNVGLPLPSMAQPMFPPDLDLIPTIPYFDLPAGLMAPLVKLEDSDYWPLDPKDIRLPPPMPPSERLLAAVEAFYCAPSHDRPRDSDGWEKLGLFEFFKAKNKAKQMKAEREGGYMGGGGGNGSHHHHHHQLPNFPLSMPQPRQPFDDNRPPNSRLQRSPSPKGRSYRRSRSRSPGDYHRSSRSPSRSRSRSPSRPNERRRSRERSHSPEYRSEPYFGEGNDQDSRIGEENKGHQLMMKMGWGGGALGASGEGITNPIENAEIRDRVDMYKGLGMSMSDPYELFRKNKSTGFNVRMRERADARATFGGNRSPR